MPAMTAEEEITRLREEQARLTVIVGAAGKVLIEMDAARKPISDKFSTAWTRRDNIQRRLFLLERKIKKCKPSTAAPKKEKSAADILASFTPAQLEMLRIILEKKV